MTRDNIWAQFCSALSVQTEQVRTDELSMLMEPLQVEVMESETPILMEEVTMGVMVIPRIKRQNLNNWIRKEPPRLISLTISIKDSLGKPG